MKILNTIAALFSTAALSVAPAMARVDVGTPGLLREVQANGLTVALNPRRCVGAAYLGSYHSGTRVLTVCYSGRPTAVDHDTVRHEVFHAAQHCAAVKRGYGNTVVPILTGTRLTQFVNQHLTAGQIRRIRASYPRHKHATELEAFAAADAYSSAEIGRIYKSWCK